MTLRKLISQAQQKGIDIQYSNRMDKKGRLRGVRIISIGGVKYSGSTGEKVLRSMFGESLSYKQSMQLEEITNKRRKPALPEDIKKSIRKIQRLARKRKLAGDEKVASIKTKNIRYTIKKYGEEQARKQLQQMERAVKKLVPLHLWDEYITRVISDVEWVNNVFSGMLELLTEWQNLALSANVDKIDYYGDFEPLMDIIYQEVELGVINNIEELTRSGIEKSINLLRKLQ